LALASGIAVLLTIPGLHAAEWMQPLQLRDDGPAMPEFTRRGADAWLNTRPLKATELRGKVVLLEIYASG
jgi:hypothetical protein